MKIDPKKLVLLPVPAGMKMLYNHYYDPPKWGIYNGIEQKTPGPHKLTGTTAILVGQDYKVLAVGESTVSKKDVPIRKLGLAIAHNRCIKAYLKQQNG